MDLKELQGFSAATNIAEHLEDDELLKIGRRCHEQYKMDKRSRKEWEKTQEKSMKLVKQVLEVKNFPWPNCANTNYPLVTVGAIQFNARAYPAIISSNMVVKGEVIGHDPQGIKTERAGRIGKHMSYQFLHEQDEWETDTDRLLLTLPVVGDVFRKTYYDPMKGRNRITNIQRSFWLLSRLILMRSRMAIIGIKAE